MKFVAVLLAICFADELQPLSDSVASNTKINCTAITSARFTNLGQACDYMPGCGYSASFDECRVDDCWKYSESSAVTSLPTSSSFTCQCSTAALSQKPSTCGAGNWPRGYPAQNTAQGSGQDFYCQKTWAAGPTTYKSALDSCALRYLRNGTCTAPFCILKDYDDDYPDIGKVCLPIPECQVVKYGTDNIIRVNTSDLCTCLQARRLNGDTTACNQNPGCYVANSGTNNDKCIPDTCYNFAVDQETPSCTGATPPPGTTCVLATVKSDLGGGAQGTKSVCVASNGNTTPNPCWGLHTATATQPGALNCPVNPLPNPEAAGSYNFQDTVSACKEDCQVVEISTYYYGSIKICVDAEHAPDAGKILKIPSVLSFLFVVLAFLLSL